MDRAPLQAPINPGDGERAVLLRAVRAGPLAVTLKRYRHDFEQAPHEHGHATIDLIVSGWGRGTYRRRDMVSCPACVEYFAPGVAHSFRCGESGICTMHVVVPGGMAASDGVSGRALDLELDPSACLGLSVALLRELTRSAGADELTVESLAFELLAEACRWPAGARRGPAWMAGVVDRLHAGDLPPPRLAELSAVAGVHPSHLAREFRRATGIAVGTYARRLRVGAAARRIAAGREPLARVAHACGYVDQAHLCRQIGRGTGLSPRKLRGLFSAAGGGR